MAHHLDFQGAVRVAVAQDTLLDREGLPDGVVVGGYNVGLEHRREGAVTVGTLDHHECRGWCLEQALLGQVIRTDIEAKVDGSPKEKVKEKMLKKMCSFPRISV